MKNILLLTDFSSNANHVAEYAYDFAKRIRASIILCNAINIPSELPNAGLVIWPMESPEIIQEQSASGLKELRKHLQQRDSTDDVKPKISVINQVGNLHDVVAEVTSSTQIDLMALGTHDNRMESFFKMNQTRKMIDALQVPTLLIPLNFKLTPIHNIYFATDLTNLSSDIAFLTQILPLARAFKSELFLVHISTSVIDIKTRDKIDLMITHLRQDLGYPGIYFREISGDSEVSTIEMLMIEKRMDLLVVVHREHGFFNRLIRGSVTKRLADDLSVPMLIFSEKKV